jgi:hypothetical protein
LPSVRLWGNDVKWFRFWTDTVNDVKMLQLSDYEYRMWTYLLSYASEVNSLSGDLQTTFTLLSLHFHQRFNHFSRAIETFQKLGLISLSESGNVTITNWNKRQFKSDDAYSRVKKYRASQTGMKRFRNVSVTAPDTDTDTDTDKPPISPKGGKKKMVFALPGWIKAETWEAYREMRQRKRAPLTDRASSLIVKELEKLKVQGNPPEEVLNQSIMKSWTGVFPLSRGGDGDGRRTDTLRGNRLPEISTPKEWEGDELPEVTDADRQRNLGKLKGITETLFQRKN